MLSLLSKDDRTTLCPRESHMEYSNTEIRNLKETRTMLPLSKPYIGPDVASSYFDTQEDCSLLAMQPLSESATFPGTVLAV